MPTLPFTAEEAALLKASHGRLSTEADRFAEALYRELFARAPFVRSLFSPSMDEQHYKLVRMVGLLVESVDDPEAFDAECRASGDRHRLYGAAPAHYEVLAGAFVAALSEVLEPTPEELALWVRMYGNAAGLMTEE